MKILWHQENMPHMNVRKNKGVTYLTWPEFEKIPGFVHGFSTRLGGVSEGIYSSMNLSFTRGDKEEAVRENYNRISAALGFSPEDIVTSDQTHTANVRVITAEDRGNGITKPRPYTDVDGMITNVPGLVLATFYADCVPLYFADPVHKAVGLSHSGWRGTAAGIGAVTVKELQKHYGTRPEDIYAAVGPSICQDCYEVSEDVILEFQKTFSRELWKDIFYRKENGKYQLNLWEANPSDPAWGRDSSGTYFHAESLYLLQSGVPLFSQGLSGKKRKSGSVSGNKAVRQGVIRRTLFCSVFTDAVLNDK